MSCSRRHIAALLLHVFVWGGVLAPAVHWASHGVGSRPPEAQHAGARAIHEQQPSVEESRALIDSVIAATAHERADEECKLCALHTTRSLWLASPTGVAAPLALHACLSIEPSLPVVAAAISLFWGRAPPRA